MSSVAPGMGQVLVVLGAVLVVVKAVVPHLLLVVVVVVVEVSIEVAHGQSIENKYKNLNSASHDGCHPCAARLSYSVTYDTVFNSKYDVL